LLLIRSNANATATMAVRVFARGGGRAKTGLILNVE
jgi:hypothetical protein